MAAYWQADPADVSVNAICKRMGVSKPALYRVFGNEDGLMRAVLARYADRVLSEIFTLLDPALPLTEACAGLIRFASEAPTMETGCVFFKMRAGKHRLGPLTRDQVEAIEGAAVAAFTAYLDARRAAGDGMPAGSSAGLARYMIAQLGLALTQRAAGEDSAQIREMLALALSVLQRP